MNDVLLTVSGNIDPQVREKIARKERPLADYVAMADTFEADLIDYQTAAEKTGWFGRLLQKIGGNNLLLAWACFVLRRQYKVVFTDGEQIGIPLAFMLKFLGWAGKRPQHLMIVHILSVGKKQSIIDMFRLQSHIDIFFVYSTWQKKFIEDRWNVPGDRVPFTPFMVDSDFFHPSQTNVTDKIEGFETDDRPMICAVGLEFRDYPTLIEAVRNIDAHVVIAAGSPWSKRSDSTAGQEIPDNVTVRRFTQFELRQIYAMSEFLAMPLYDVEFQAGVTALLEAMSMEKAVICSSTPGQTDVVADGQSGIYVPPGDSAAFKIAIERLLNDKQLCDNMGKAGRKIIEDEMSLKQYVKRLNRYVLAGKSA